jgi:hypothetical protein
MVVSVASKVDYAGSPTPSGLSVETTLVNPPVQTVDAYIEGYVSLQNMQSGDIVVVTEYVAVDGTNYEILNQQTYTDVPPSPAVRFSGKLVGPIANGAGGGMRWKATVNQTAGTVRAFPYSATLLVLNS